MIYDCILFNDELDILEFRLNYMCEHVDKFIICESALTFSNQNKPLHFKQSAARFSRFKTKIIYLEIPPLSTGDSWQNEFYQRNYVKKALSRCAGDDIILIADVDELVNLAYIVKNEPLTKPMLIQMPMYYYFLNLKTEINWQKTLITPYQYIKEFDLGDRDKFWDLKPGLIESGIEPAGWHFSYLFGWNIGLYLSKLKSFAHQEFNTPYYLEQRRIQTCLKLGIDFLERYNIYTAVDVKKEFPPKLYEAMNSSLMGDNYLYHKPPVWFYFNTYNLKYYLKYVLKLKVRMFIKELFKRNHGRNEY